MWADVWCCQPFNQPTEQLTIKRKYVCNEKTRKTPQTMDDLEWLVKQRQRWMRPVVVDGNCTKSTTILVVYLSHRHRHIKMYVSYVQCIMHQHCTWTAKIKECAADGWCCFCSIFFTAFRVIKSTIWVILFDCWSHIC